MMAEEFKNPIGNKESAHKSCEAKKARHNENKAAFFSEIGIINDFSSENSGNNNKNSLNKQYITATMAKYFSQKKFGLAGKKNIKNADKNKKLFKK